MSRIMIVVMGLVVSMASMFDAQQAATDSKQAISASLVGKTYQFKMRSETESQETKYLGKVVRVTDEAIVLEQATLVVRKEEAVPVFGGVPMLGKLFKNVSLAVQELEGRQTISRQKIESFEHCKAQPGKLGMPKERVSSDRVKRVKRR